MHLRKPFDLEVSLVHLTCGVPWRELEKLLCLRLPAQRLVLENQSGLGAGLDKIQGASEQH